VNIICVYSALRIVRLVSVRMAADTVEFVSWEEHIISQERGNRVVHYFLKDSSGNLILAVQGTERSVRHMIYVVSDEFIDKYESMNYVNSSTKWRARRDVIDWLSRLVSWPQSKSGESLCKQTARVLMLMYLDHNGFLFVLRNLYAFWSDLT